MKFNGFKLLVFVEIIIISILTIFLYKDYQESKDVVQFGNLEINPQTLSELVEPLGAGRFIICELNSNKCTIGEKG